MANVLILGTDTDAGKTTLALLWLTAWADRYDYWKPVETGPADSQTLAALVPQARIHSSLRHFSQPVAPPLAARLSGGGIPSAASIAAIIPRSNGRQLLVETFGSPFSPLNDTELQITLIQALNMPTVLVSSSTLGTIGRTLQCLYALEAHEVHPRAVVLIGPIDEFAVRELNKVRSDLSIFSLQPPVTWTVAGLTSAVAEQVRTLEALRQTVESPPSILTPGSRAPEENSDLLVERDRKAIWHPYTSLGEPEPPLVCTGAQDEFLLLGDGRRVIDGISSWWTILHGHRYPPLVAALREALEKFDHVHFAGVTHAPGVELAELLLGSLPWAGGRAFYSDNGSTAVEVALKMAYQFWCHHGQQKRTRFVGFENGYHGDTFGAMSVSRDPLFFGRFEPLLFQANILPLSPERLEDFLSRKKEEVAGVILEPLVQGAGGMRMHSPKLLQQIFEVTRRHGVLFLADEVMTGGGRTGSLWAHQAAGIEPDLICAGKTLTGGMLPLAVTLAAPQVVRAFATPDRTRTFYHGHSFTAHPLACAVAAANWRLLTRKPDTSAFEMEGFWHEALASLQGSSRVREVRIQGSIAAVEVACSGGYLAEAGRHLRRVCLQEGVLLRPLGSVLYAMPPLRTSHTSLEKIATAMIRAIETLPQ